METDPDVQTDTDDSLHQWRLQRRDLVTEVNWIFIFITVNDTWTTIWGPRKVLSIYHSWEVALGFGNGPC